MSELRTVLGELGDTPKRADLISHLVATGRLSDTDAARSVRLTRDDRPVAVLTRLGLIGESELAQVISAWLGLAEISRAEFPDEVPSLDGRISMRFLEFEHIVPLWEDERTLTVAAADPSNKAPLDALAFALGKHIEARVARLGDIEACLERLTGVPASDNSAGQEIAEDVERLKDLASEAPVIRLVNQIITRAAEWRASDIHIEPSLGRLRLRFRIDGVLHDQEPPPASLAAALVSRVKVMAKLDIAERRLAQDGRIRLAVRGRELDLRVSTTPTVHGEGVVLRLLDREALTLELPSLGFDGPTLKRFQGTLARPHGIVLVTGPTGSGKTTTLYAALTTLNRPESKILTIEDPVEYQIEGVNQLQVNPKIGLTFSSALRSFLRQDPDIMMIGEIRDLETAQIAVQASLTGHLILSTLHTNSAASAVTRLLDMGIEDYLLTSTVNALVGQRLVRRLCPACREPTQPLPELVERLGLGELAGSSPPILYVARGCDACAGTGYRGRIAIVELLVMSDAIRQQTLRRTEAGSIERQAIEEGMETMRACGLRRALTGDTTLEEVLRTV